MLSNTEIVSEISAAIPIHSRIIYYVYGPQHIRLLVVTTIMRVINNSVPQLFKKVTKTPRSRVSSNKP